MRPLLPHRSTRVDGVLLAVVGLATILITYLRLPAIVRGTVWAEDGRLFLNQRAADGAWVDFFTPHGGYLQAFPRLATEAIVAFVPLEKYAVAAAASAGVILALLAVAVYVVSGTIIPWRPARVALALLPAVMPTGPTEVLGNLANVHWAFLAMMPVLLLGRPATWKGVSLLSALVFLAVLTEIQCVIFAPLLLVGWRDRKRIPLMVAMGLGALLQISAYLGHARDTAHALVHVPSVVQGFLVQSVLGSIFGSADVLSNIVQDTGLILPLIFLVLFVASFVYTIVRGTVILRILAIAFLSGAVVAWLAAVTVNGIHDMNYFSFGAQPFPGFYIIRYGYAPSVMMLALPVLATAVAHRRGNSLAAWAILVILTLVFAANFRTSSSARDLGPSWIDGYRSAVTQCETGDVESVTITTAPVEWAASLPCSYLLPQR